MIVVGFESSANKIAVGVVKGETILANIRKTYVPPDGEGFIPAEAAEFHRLSILGILEEALKTAGIKIEDSDAIAYTRGPGMLSTLLVGATVASTLATLFMKPLIPVNHCVAHIEMGRLVTKAKNPVILYASGGNTQVIAYGNQRYSIFGETLDIAVGNTLDKIARYLGLENYPSPGFSIEKAARKGSKYIEMPYVVKGMDISFSGILSHIKQIKEKESVENICYSLQETMFSMLVEVTERCLSLCGSSEVLVVGGVGCNLRLQEMLKKMLDERGGTLCATDERYCIDNGLMIAYTGYLMLKCGLGREVKDCDVTQRFRTDSVSVKWRDYFATYCIQDKNN